MRVNQFFMKTVTISSITPIMAGLVVLIVIISPLSVSAQLPNVVSIMPNGSFSPHDLTVAIGSTVTWKNTDQSAHRVISDNGLFDSRDIQGGGTFSYVFNDPGSFHYHEGSNRDQVGTINVG